MKFLPYGYFVELQVRRNKPWDPGIIFESCSLNAQHLEDKVFLMGQGVIGKHERMPETQEAPASMVQRGEGTKRRVVKLVYLADYV